MKTYRLAILIFSLALVAAQAWATTELYWINDSAPAFHESTDSIAGMVEEVGIALDTAALDREPANLSFVLPDGRELTAGKTHFEAEQYFLSWSGRIGDSDGTRGYMHLIDRGEQVTGIINVGVERFQIVPNEYGHRLVRVELEDKVCFFEIAGENHDSVAGDGHDTWLPGPALATTADPTSLESTSGPATTGAKEMKSLTYIDVLAVYPNAFSGSAETGVRQFIENSVSVANSVFANSNVNTRYNLIAKVKLAGFDQPPATDLVDALEWMTPTQVGSQDVDEIGPQEVLDLRDQYAADMVALFVPFSYNGLAACGIANLPQKNGDIRPYIPNTASPGDFGKRAYTVHRDGCGLNDFTLAHELGHNFGMRHNTDEDTNSSEHLFPYGRGHALSAAPWRDIANGTLQTNVPGNFTVGYHFTPFVDGYIVGLGGLFSGAKAIKLWDYATGNLLAIEVVTGNNTWTYEELLVPIAVAAGTKYTVAAHTGGTGGSIYSNVLPFPRASGQVTIHGTTATAGSARPTNTVTDIMYGQFDVRFVPEAALAASVLGCARFLGGNIADEVCHRVEVFSDPTLQIGGYTTGTSTRNNAAVARSQSSTYANFRTNSAPVCQNDFLTTSLNTKLSVTLGDLLGNDFDPEGGPVWLDVYDLVTAQGGSNDTGHIGGFKYTPPSGFTGVDTFNYTIRDIVGLTDTCVVTVTILGRSGRQPEP